MKNQVKIQLIKIIGQTDLSADQKQILIGQVQASEHKDNSSGLQSLGLVLSFIDVFDPDIGYQILELFKWISETQ